jgi:hypothetical protein
MKKDIWDIIRLLKHIWDIIEILPFIKEHWIISFVIFIIVISFLGNAKTENNESETEEKAEKPASEKYHNMEENSSLIGANMKAILFFRFILIASVLTAIISVVLNIMLIDTLPHSLQAYLSSQDQNMGNINNKEAALGMLFLIVFIVLSTIFFIGVWNFKRWARILFVVITVFGLLAIPLIGEPLITVPLAYMFESTSAILSGMLLVLMYTAPIKYYFSKSEKSSPINQSK